MPHYQVDYTLRTQGFAQVEAESEEQAIEKVSEVLDGEIDNIDAFELSSGSPDERPDPASDDLDAGFAGVMSDPAA